MFEGRIWHGVIQIMWPMHREALGSEMKCPCGYGFRVQWSD